MVKEHEWNNKSFWDDRYESDGWLGSGPGSRGYAKVYKKELLIDVINNNYIQSIADIGCGDLCWLGKNSFDHIVYSGFDISGVIIEKNKLAFPEMNFSVFDIVAQSLNIDKDLVVCFDVLIHQVKINDFVTALTNLLSSISSHALVSYHTQHESTENLAKLQLPAYWHEENLFNTEREAKKGASSSGLNCGLGMVANHGDLADWIKTINSNFKVRTIGAYRYQTIYELSLKNWLNFGSASTFQDG